MAGIDNLKNRLLQDDKDKASAIENEAKAKAEEIINGAKAKADSILQEIKIKAEKDGKDKKDRIISRAQLDARNSILAAKQESIDMVLNLTIKRFASMEKDEYSGFIEKLLLNNVETGDEEVIFSINDKSRINEAVIENVNRQLQEMGRKGELKLSNESRNIVSGFILKRGGLEINCSIDSQIRVLRDSLESDIANLLFNQ